MVVVRIIILGVVNVTMDVQSLPIDIHYNKLLGKDGFVQCIVYCLMYIDWLIDRRHCELRWHQQLQEIKSKIKRALPSLPKDELIINGILNKEGIFD